MMAEMINVTGYRLISGCSFMGRKPQTTCFDRLTDASTQLNDISVRLASSNIGLSVTFRHSHQWQRFVYGIGGRDMQDGGGRSIEA
jgi:hypothetical protein